MSWNIILNLESNWIQIRWDLDRFRLVAWQPWVQTSASGKHDATNWYWLKLHWIELSSIKVGNLDHCIKLQASSVSTKPREWHAPTGRAKRASFPILAKGPWRSGPCPNGIAMDEPENDVVIDVASLIEVGDVGSDHVSCFPCGQWSPCPLRGLLLVISRRPYILAFQWMQRKLVSRPISTNLLHLIKWFHLLPAATFGVSAWGEWQALPRLLPVVKEAVNLKNITVGFKLHIQQNPAFFIKGTKHPLKKPAFRKIIVFLLG